MAVRFRTVVLTLLLCHYAQNHNGTMPKKQIHKITKSANHNGTMAQGRILADFLAVFIAFRLYIIINKANPQSYQ
jgi:hypothetical protein